MGTGTIGSATAGSPIPASDHNDVKGALSEDFYPRNSSGVVANEAGSLGSAVKRWNNTYSTSFHIGTTGLSITEESGEIVFTLAGGERARITNDHLQPPGMIAPYAGTSAPSGWLLCNGAAVSRTTYARLYAAIGDSFGEGDGGTTVNVPDFRGRVLRGVDGAIGRDPDAATRTAMNTGGNTGDNVGSIQVEGTKLPTADFGFVTDDPGTHTHNYNITNGGTDGSTNPKGATTAGGPQATDANGAHTHADASWSGGDSETRMINAYINYIIKT